MLTLKAKKVTSGERGRASSMGSHASLRGNATVSDSSRPAVQNSNNSCEDGHSDSNDGVSDNKDNDRGVFQQTGKKKSELIGKGSDDLVTSYLKAMAAEEKERAQQEAAQRQQEAAQRQQEAAQQAARTPDVATGGRTDRSKKKKRVAKGSKPANTDQVSASQTDLASNHNADVLLAKGVANGAGQMCDGSTAGTVPLTSSVSASFSTASFPSFHDNAQQSVPPVVTSDAHTIPKASAAAVIELSDFPALSKEIGANTRSNGALLLPVAAATAVPPGFVKSTLPGTNAAQHGAGVVSGPPGFATGSMAARPGLSSIASDLLNPAKSRDVETASSAAVDVYTRPPDFELRNQILMQRMTSQVNDEQFARFKSLSASFRQSLIGADVYYAECARAFCGNHSVFGELLLLLPDVSKQNELLSAYEAMAGGSGRGVCSGEFERCHLCRQVLRPSDVTDHLARAHLGVFGDDSTAAGVCTDGSSVTATLPAWPVTS